MEIVNPCAHVFFDTSVGVNWQARTYQAAEEQTDLGVAADTSWHIIRIEVGSVAVRFYLDGTLKATHTAQIPNAGLPFGMDSATVVLFTREAVAKYARYAHVAIWLE